VGAVVRAVLGRRGGGGEGGFLLLLLLFLLVQLLLLLLLFLFLLARHRGGGDGQGEGCGLCEGEREREAGARLGFEEEGDGDASEEKPAQKPAQKPKEIALRPLQALNSPPNHLRSSDHTLKLTLSEQHPQELLSLRARAHKLPLSRSRAPLDAAVDAFDLGPRRQRRNNHAARQRLPAAGARRGQQQALVSEQTRARARAGRVADDPQLPPQNQNQQEAPTTAGPRRHHAPIKPPIPTASQLPPPCGLRSDVDWIGNNKAELAAAALSASKRRSAADARLRSRPPPRALDGKDERATEFWLRGKPGYGKAPQFCGDAQVSSSSSSSSSKSKRPTTTANPSSTAAATPPPLPDEERLALLARAKARHASLSAQYGRLPLCFAADTPSGLMRREQLGKALDQAAKDVEALGQAGQVVVVVVGGAAGAAAKT
jgi:hypothetical protein